MSFSRLSTPPSLNEIITDFALGIVNTLEEANALPENYEPVVTEEGGQLSLYQVVEDELILSLPIIPKHEPEACSAKLESTGTGVEQDILKNPIKPIHNEAEIMVANDGLPICLNIQHTISSITILMAKPLPIFKPMFMSIDLWYAICAQGLPTAASAIFCCSSILAPSG